MVQERERERRWMVESQVAARGIEDLRVLAAMLVVPRHRFVGPDAEPHAYEDRVLDVGEGRRLSEPYPIAQVVEAATLAPTDRVLEIGSGSGYAAAILARIAAEVMTLEPSTTLAARARAVLDDLGYANVQLRAANGSLGWPEGAPFDAIVLTAAVPEIPGALIDQLARDRGRMVVPLGDPRDQRLIRIIRDGEELHREDLGAIRCAPLTQSADV